MAIPIVLVLLSLDAFGWVQSDATLRKEIDALNAAMVDAFKRDPSTVAAFYTDDALIAGGGQRYQGRAAVDGYWGGATMFSDWTLETLVTGGTAEAPWQYGRSVLIGKSGRTMETYFFGFLRRQPSGALKFQIDAFSRARQEIEAGDASRITAAWQAAVARSDPSLLSEVFDDSFVIRRGARDVSALR